MADHVLESRMWLARPRPDVFALFTDPRHLELLTPPSMCLRLLTPGAVMAAGAVCEVGEPAPVPGRGRQHVGGGPRVVPDAARPAGRRRARAAGAAAAARAVGLPASAAGGAGRRRQAFGRLMPSFSRRGRTRSVSRPMRARLATIELCMSLRKYFRKGA